MPALLQPLSPSVSISTSDVVHLEYPTPTIASQSSLLLVECHQLFVLLEPEYCRPSVILPQPQPLVCQNATLISPDGAHMVSFVVQFFVYAATTRATRLFSLLNTPSSLRS